MAAISGSVAPQCRTSQSPLHGHHRLGRSYRSASVLSSRGVMRMTFGKECASSATRSRPWGRSTSSRTPSSRSSRNGRSFRPYRTSGGAGSCSTCTPTTTRSYSRDHSLPRRSGRTLAKLRYALVAQLAHGPGVPDRGRSTRDAAESGAGRLAGDGGCRRARRVPARRPRPGSGLCRLRTASQGPGREARRGGQEKPRQEALPTRSPAGSATWCCRSSSRWASRTPEKPTPTPWTGMRR